MVSHCSALRTLLFTYLDSFNEEERLDKQTYTAFTRVHCCWYQGMEREGKPARGLHWEMLQEGQGLDSLFSGPSHMFELQAQPAWVKKAKCCCPLVLPQRVQLVTGQQPIHATTEAVSPALANEGSAGLPGASQDHRTLCA